MLVFHILISLGNQKALENCIMPKAHSMGNFAKLCPFPIFNFVAYTVAFTLVWGYQW